jgi:hypothetical protein
MVAVPAATPVTNPVLEFTVAILVLLLLHVPPTVVFANWVVNPAQTLNVPVIGAGTAGRAFKVTAKVLGMLAQVLVPVAVTLQFPLVALAA